MADFQLTCVIQERGVIRQVGVEGTIYTVQRIIGSYQKRIFPLLVDRDIIST
ncbi:MAG TPA: hypothetical protein VIP29_05240 [Nitrososphaeraceae archaeon]